MTAPSPTPTHWYYSAQGHAQGPFTEEQLSELVTRGSVSVDTLLWRPGMDLWEPAGQLKPEMLPSAPATPPLTGSAPDAARKSALKPIPQVEPLSDAPAAEENASGGLFSKLFGRLKKK
jgi:hypothetical protein